MAVQVKGLQSFVSHVDRVVTTANAFDTQVVTSMAKDAKVAIIASASPHRLSRFNNGKGITLGARYEVTGTKPASAVIAGTPPGPWALMEAGAAAHPIGKRTGGKGKRGLRGQAGFLGSTERGFAAFGPVQHPATAPQHTWEKSAAVAIAKGEVSFARAKRHEYVKFATG